MEAKEAPTPYLETRVKGVDKQFTVHTTRRGYSILKKIVACLIDKHPGSKVVRPRLVESLFEAEAKRLGLKVE